MSYYARLSSIVDVPEEWMGKDSLMIYNLLKKAVSHYRAGDKVIVTKRGASAMIVKDELSFSFEKIEEIDNDHTHMIDFLLPERASIIKLKYGRPVYSQRKEVSDMITNQTQDHPFSQLFDLRFDKHIIVTAVPDIKKIFESHGIKPEEMYNYALETIYKTHKGLEPGPQKFIKPQAKGHPFVSVEKITDDQWELKCYERLKRSRSITISCFSSSVDS